MAADAPTIDDFHATHRGGSGLVFIVEGKINGELEHRAVFGSVEAADRYIDTFEDKRIFWNKDPYVVDDPEWGDRRTN
jgi:hypothetical protein